jgi:hypothetical protein
LNEASQQYFESSDIDITTGITKKVSATGNRTLYTRNSGLSGLYLGRSLYLYSGNDNLAYSDDDGRVVLVSTAEGGVP